MSQAPRDLQIVAGVISGYRGYGCTDATNAHSYSLQMGQMFFLILSNLVFLPGIVVATLRHYYTEALVYCFMMFSSTVCCHIAPLLH